ncbi:MAG TPA: transglycosylase SLT domain-containing protein, partial [Armatimonadota bacterium]|nr:transglycosylase SLT domain-containing protein [Armatimonadota bacterium]
MMDNRSSSSMTQETGVSSPDQLEELRQRYRALLTQYFDVVSDKPLQPVLFAYRPDGRRVGITDDEGNALQLKPDVTLPDTRNSVLNQVYDMNQRLWGANGADEDTPVDGESVAAISPHDATIPARYRPILDNTVPLSGSRQVPTMVNTSTSTNTKTTMPDTSWSAQKRGNITKYYEMQSDFVPVTDETQATQCNGEILRDLNGKPVQAKNGANSVAYYLTVNALIGRTVVPQRALGTPYEKFINDAGHKYGVDPALLAGLIEQESHFNPNAKSSAGARGLTQLMPATAHGLQFDNLFDPQQSIEAGAKYLKQQLDHFHNDLRLALAAYNAGPGNVKKYGGIPPFHETQQYVVKVMQNAKKYGYGTNPLQQNTAQPSTNGNDTSQVAGQPIDRMLQVLQGEYNTLSKSNNPDDLRMAAEIFNAIDKKPGVNIEINKAVYAAAQKLPTANTIAANGNGADQSHKVPADPMLRALQDDYNRLCQSDNPDDLRTAAVIYNAMKNNPDMHIDLNPAVYKAGQGSASAVKANASAAPPLTQAPAPVGKASTLTTTPTVNTQKGNNTTPQRTSTNDATASGTKGKFSLPNGVTSVKKNSEIVGKLVPFPSIPNVTFTGSDPRISNVAIEPLRRVAEEAEKLGYTVKVTSAYRTFAHQQEIWDAERKHYPSDAEARKKVAKPGNSPHHTGGAIDIDLVDKYGNTNRNNAHLAAVLER